MNTGEKKRNYAERLYVEEGWTATSIAATVGVNRNTVSNWVKKYKWQEKKDELLAAPHKVKQIILQEIQRVVAGEPPTFNSDDLSKLTRALERVDQKVSVQMIISVFKAYNNWLASQEVDNDFLLTHIDHSKMYLQYQIAQEQ